MFRQRLSKVWKNKNKFIDDGPRSAEWCFQKWSCSSSHGWISTFSCFTSPSWQNAWSMNFGLVSSWPCPHSGYLTLGRHLKPRRCHFHKPLDIHLFPTVFDKKIKRLIVFFFYSVDFTGNILIHGTFIRISCISHKVAWNWRCLLSKEDFYSAVLYTQKLVLVLALEPLCTEADVTWLIGSLWLVSLPQLLHISQIMHCFSPDMTHHDM